MSILMQRVVCTNMVHLQGAVGRHAAIINGLYEPTEELVSNVSVYRKVGDTDKWIEYVDGEWWVKLTENRGDADGYAKASIYPAKAPEKCPTDCWQIGIGSGNKNFQPTFSVSISTRASFEAAYAAQVGN